MYDVIILGSGPAGLTAAIYCGRANKNTLVMGGDTLGGQTSTIASLENYPGWRGSGLELIDFIKTQAESFGARVQMKTAAHIKNGENNTFIVTDPVVMNMNHVLLFWPLAHHHEN